jgi:catechol 2,3-dioxygenase-like lactoylglutathione lyase family enzyme
MDTVHITGLDHTSFTVANLERSLAFYAGQLGFEVLWQRTITEGYFQAIVGLPGCAVKAAHLRIPGSTHKLELFEYVAPPGQPADVRTNNPGSAHLALYVDDLPAAYAALKAQGMTFRSPPVLIDAGANRGGYAVYLLDPDDITVELFQKPAARAQD